MEPPGNFFITTECWLSISQETEVHACILTTNYSKNASRPQVSVCICSLMTHIAKVLSDTIADAMRKRKDDALTAMITFVDFFDTFFDCLKVRNLSSSKRRTF